MKHLSIGLCLSAALVLTACEKDEGGTPTNSPDTSNPQISTTLSPAFNPREGQLPTTNNVMFSGSVDGTLAIPTDSASASEKVLYDALNTLDGFGLTTPFTTDFTGSIDASSLIIGDTVHVYETSTDPTTNRVSGIVRELNASEMYVSVLSDTDTTADTLAFLPLKPLKESTEYMVVLTQGIKDMDGKMAAIPAPYTLLQSGEVFTGNFAALEGLRLLVNAQIAATTAHGIATDNIILSWSFTTQSVTPTLDAVREQASAQTMVVSPTIGSTKNVNPLLRGAANVHTGTLDVPYYLDAAAPTSSYWKGVGGSLLSRHNPAPVSTSTQTIPVLISVPNDTSAVGTNMPEAGWPVVIFQHGITRNRLDLLALADTLADVGFVGIAIDLPLHGITDTTSPLKASNSALSADDTERTFNLDLQNNTTGATGADGNLDDSGKYFINLSSLLTSRDNSRQAISDLLVLRRSLSNISNIQIDTDRVGFVGLSLGGIVGTSYLAVESLTTPSSIVAAGGGIARLLDGSETFSPIIQAGLAANGVIKGTASYDTFMTVTQWVTDSSDPIVLGATAAAKHPIHMIEIVGAGGIGSDNVVPNRVAGAPLSGTEPLAAVMGLANITETTQNTAGVDGIVRFNQGAHGSLLDPTSSFAATLEMQTEVAAFQASAGTLINIMNPLVISTD